MEGSLRGRVDETHLQSDSAVCYHLPNQVALFFFVFHTVFTNSGTAGGQQLKCTFLYIFFCIGLTLITTAPWGNLKTTTREHSGELPLFVTVASSSLRFFFLPITLEPFSENSTKPKGVKRKREETASFEIVFNL